MENNEIIKFVREFAAKCGAANVFHYSAAEEKCIFEKQAEETGYQRISTFFADLSIAEYVEGLNGVRDTYNRVVKEWLSDYKMFSELVISINWKSWEWAARGCSELGQLYSDLYYDARDKFYERYDGTHEGDKDATRYFFEVTD